jgi:hypothetical protein
MWELFQRQKDGDMNKITHDLIHKYRLTPTTYQFRGSFNKGFRIYELPTKEQEAYVIAFSEINAKGRPPRTDEIFLWVKEKNYLYGSLIAYPEKSLFIDVRLEWLKTTDKKRFRIFVEEKIREFEERTNFWKEQVNNLLAQIRSIKERIQKRA